MQLELTAETHERRTISPFRELGAYEAMWDDMKASFKSIADKFRERPGAIPSDFIPPSVSERYADAVQEKFHSSL